MGAPAAPRPQYRYHPRADLPTHASRAAWISELTDAGERDPDHDVGQRAERDEAAAKEYPSHCLTSLFPTSPSNSSLPISFTENSSPTSKRCHIKLFQLSRKRSARRCGTVRQTPKLRFQENRPPRLTRHGKNPGAGDSPPLALTLLKVVPVATHTPLNHF